MNKFPFLAILNISPLYTCSFSFSSPYSHGNQGMQNLNYKVPFGIWYKGFFCSCMVGAVRIGYERIGILIFSCTKVLLDTYEFCNVSVCSGQWLRKFTFWKYVLFYSLPFEYCWFMNQLPRVKAHWNFELILIDESKY